MYYQQALFEFASEMQDVLMKDQAVYFITQLRLIMPFHIGYIDFREGCLIILVHQFKLYLKEENSIWYVLQLLQSMKCVLEHQNCQKKINEFLLVPDDDDTNDTRVFMPQNDPYAVPKHMRQELKDKANDKKPQNTGKNWSKPYQKPLLEM